MQPKRQPRALLVRAGGDSSWRASCAAHHRRTNEQATAADHPTFAHATPCVAREPFLCPLPPIEQPCARVPPHEPKPALNNRRAQTTAIVLSSGIAHKGDALTRRPSRCRCSRTSYPTATRCDPTCRGSPRRRRARRSGASIAGAKPWARLPGQLCSRSAGGRRRAASPRGEG